MNLLKSLAKSWRLTQISRKLDAPPVRSVEELFSRGASRDAAVDELLDLCESTPELRAVMEKYGANRDTLRAAYQRVAIAGGAQWVRGHYVAASALAFVPTLDFVLRHMQERTSSRNESLVFAYRLITYFQNGETGWIDQRGQPSARLMSEHARAGVRLGSPEEPGTYPSEAFDEYQAA